MTLPTPFVDGFRLTDGTQLNNVTGNPQWSTSPAVTATLGGNVLTSYKVTEAVTNVASAAGNGAGVTLPPALPGLIKLIANNTNYSITVFAAGGSTVDGIAGSIGVSVPAQATFMFVATDVNQWAVFDWNSSPIGNTNGIVTTPNLASLRLIDLYGSPYQYAVWMKGYYTDNDDGQGLFYWVTNNNVSIYPDDGGATIIPNPARTQYAWKRVTGDSVNIKMWGAQSVSDGNPDALPAIDTAFANAVKYLGPSKSFGTRTLIIPQGAYRVDATLTLPTSIALEGATFFPTFVDQGAASAIYSPTFHYFGAGFCMIVQNGAGISNLKLIARGSTTLGITQQAQSGLQIQSGDNSIYSNIEILDFGTIGMQVGFPYQAGVACYFCMFTNITVANGGKASGSIVVDPAVLSGQYGVIFEGSNIQNNSGNIINNLFVRGQYKHFLDVRGQANVFIGGDMEAQFGAGPNGGNWIESIYRFSGYGNKVINPYLEFNYTDANNIPVLIVNNPKLAYFSGPTGGVLLSQLPLDGDAINFYYASTNPPAGPPDASITFRNVVTNVYTECLIGATVIDTNTNLYNMIANCVANPASAPVLATLAPENSYNTVILRLQTNTTTTFGLVNVTPSVNPPRIRVATNILNVATANRFEANLITNSAYTKNIFASVTENGTRNYVDFTPSGQSSTGVVGLPLFPSQNQVYNSNFKILNPATGLPLGWVLQAGASATVTYDTTFTLNNSPSIKMAVQNGQLAEIRYYVHHSNPSASSLQTFPWMPASYIAGKTLTVGVWCWSDTAGIGAIYFPNTNACRHTGSSSWEFLTATFRVPWNVVDATYDLPIYLQSAQNPTAPAATVAAVLGAGVTATCYFTNPVVVLGEHIAQFDNPRNITDAEGLMMGRLAWNPPIALTPDQTTYDVSAGNVFKEANTVNTGVTTFTGGRPGQEITILATTANMGFVNNAGTTVNTIKTGAGTVNTVAGKAFKLVFNGTQWQLV